MSEFYKVNNQVKPKKHFNIANKEMQMDKKEYQNYLISEHWQTLRRIKLESSGYKCQVCGSVDNLHVHHNTYKNLFKESLFDLCVLCQDCHNVYHEKINPEEPYKTGRQQKKDIRIKVNSMPEFYNLFMEGYKKPWINEYLIYDFSELDFNNLNEKQKYIIKFEFLRRNKEVWEEARGQQIIFENINIRCEETMRFFESKHLDFEKRIKYTLQSFKYI